MAQTNRFDRRIAPARALASWALKKWLGSELKLQGHSRPPEIKYQIES